MGRGQRQRLLAARNGGQAQGGDPAVRELMGYTWSPRQEQLHRAFGTAIYRLTRVLPKRMLMHPRKRSAWDRAHGRLPVDAPLVETQSSGSEAKSTSV